MTDSARIGDGLSATARMIPPTLPSVTGSVDSSDVSHPD
jgi:hypothetical protein